MQLVSSDDFIKWFDHVLTMWPRELDIKEKVLLPNGGMRIPELTTCHDDIEEKIDDELSGLDCHIASAVEFAIYTYLHGRLREESYTNVSRGDINIYEIKKILNSYDDWIFE